jgi:cytochrome c-type biogenesis protein CcmH
VSGRIELVGALQAQAKPDDVVFVFARGAQGPGMPLAVMRSRVRDLPLSFTLDDSMAMPGGPRLSTAREVVVGARISKSGQATPSPGDFEGFSAPVAVGSRNVNVIISAVRP